MAKTAQTITGVKEGFPFEPREENVGLVIVEKNKRYTCRVVITNITGNIITWEKLTKNGYVIGSSTFSDYGCKAKYFIHLDPDTAEKIDNSEEKCLVERVKSIYTPNASGENVKKSKKEDGLVLC